MIILCDGKIVYNRVKKNHFINILLLFPIYIFFVSQNRCVKVFYEIKSYFFFLHVKGKTKYYVKKAEKYPNRI